MTGSNTETVVKSEEKMETVVLENKECSYSYYAAPNHVFVDSEFNQYEIDAETIPDLEKYLIPEMSEVCEVTFYEGRPISVVLPKVIVREVEYTEPAARGDTSGKITKAAILKGTKHETSGLGLHRNWRQDRDRHRDWRIPAAVCVTAGPFRAESSRGTLTKKAKIEEDITRIRSNCQLASHAGSRCCKQAILRPCPIFAAFPSIHSHRLPFILLPRLLGPFGVKTFPAARGGEPGHYDLLVQSLFRLVPLGDFFLQRRNIPSLFVSRINVCLTVAAWQGSLDRLPLFDRVLAQGGLHRIERRALAGPLGFVLPVLLLRPEGRWQSPGH